MQGAHDGAARAVPVTADGDVALLIDYENLKWSLHNRFHIGPNISSIVEAAGEQGRLVVARAYADWTDARMRVDAPNLYRAGIEPIYVPGGVRNSADVRLAVDAVDICGRFANIATFVLVTGDQDLIHALNFLRLQGRRVVIIGAGYATSAFLSASADAVLLYERDIQPLEALEALGPLAIPAPPLEESFAQMRAVLSATGRRDPVPLTKLGSELRLRHGLVAREAYGMSFRALVQRAAEAGELRLSTIGGFDYASLADWPEPQLETPAMAAAADARGPEVATGWSVDLEDLALVEQRALLVFLHDLQESSSYMTFKYMVDNLVYHGVLPRLSREQVSSLVNGIADRGILVRSVAKGLQPDTGLTYTYNIFALDPAHPVVRAVLAPPAGDAFAELLPAIAEARSEGGEATPEAVRQALERRIGRDVTSFGFDSPRAYFLAAQLEGLVELVPLPEGGEVVRASAGA
jgi:uncharacterized protein (TIGR00288 family)